MTICAKCTHHKTEIMLGAFSSPANPILLHLCTSKQFEKVNFVSGELMAVFCDDINKSGNCPAYEERTATR